MIGGAYLAFEATEKIAREAAPRPPCTKSSWSTPIADPAELETLQVKGAIRTDFILSAEIMAIALASLGELIAGDARRPRWSRSRIAITVGVYGVVALIVKLDDIGLHLAERRSAGARAFGNGLVHVVPELLTALSGIGTAAMLWVGGGILLHGLEELHILDIRPARHPRLVAASAAEPIGALAGVVEWLLNALGGAIVGLIIGGIIVVDRPPLHQASGRADRRPRLSRSAAGGSCRGSRARGRGSASKLALTTWPTRM